MASANAMNRGYTFSYTLPQSAYARLPCVALPICLASTRCAKARASRQRNSQQLKATGDSAGAKPRSAASARPVDSNGIGFSRDLMGPNWSNRGRLSDDMLSSLMTLPGTRGMAELRDRAEALTAWKIALQKGHLPRLDTVSWPQEPFKTKFAQALQGLEMPRFTRRYPAILDTLIRQMLTLVEDFETKLSEANEQQQQQQQQKKQKSMPQQQSQQQPSQQQQQEQKEQEEQQTEQGGQAGESQEGEGQQSEGQQDQDVQMDEEMMKEMMEQMQEQAQQQEEQQQAGQGKKLNITLQQQDGQAADGPQDNSFTLKIDKMAEDIVKGFQKQMAEVMENLGAGELVFDDLNALLDSNEGFDLASGTWRKTGWKELKSLRKVLEDCTELRELVRQLGRGGGKGPLRRAPEELEAPGYPPGVIRSPLQPEEVRGLTRSSDLGRMLPSEMALLAHGWPRKVREDGVVPKGAVMAPSRTNTDSSDDEASARDMTHSVDSDDYDLQEYYLPGAHAARMLHRVRRAESALMSYERTGWLEDQPAMLTNRMEIRPAAELGPIILCLDTSGSMTGARELVAKALALECLRGAHRQRRACYLYAFSGPRDVQELELKQDIQSLDKLLDFLSRSFMGGTDVDQPLFLALERLKKQEWAQADILMVTDGEIPMPNKTILDSIKAMHDGIGLEVHGLLVSSTVSEPMKKLCTDVHVFKSWTAVGGKDFMYA